MTAAGKSHCCFGGKKGLHVGVKLRTSASLVNQNLNHYQNRLYLPSVCSRTRNWSPVFSVALCVLNRINVQGEKVTQRIMVKWQEVQNIYGMGSNENMTVYIYTIAQVLSLTLFGCYHIINETASTLSRQHIIPILIYLIYLFFVVIATYRIGVRYRMIKQQKRLTNCKINTIVITSHTHQQIVSTFISKSDSKLYVFCSVLMHKIKDLIDQRRDLFMKLKNQGFTSSSVFQTSFDSSADSSSFQLFGEEAKNKPVNFGAY